MRLAVGLRFCALLASYALSGCQQAAPSVQALAEPVPLNGVGYMVFNARIVPASRDLFVAELEKLRNAGAREIDIGMNSPGGDIDAAQAMVAYMTATHNQKGVTFKVYNMGLVASAATFVFLNAQTRYSAAQSAFLFHAAGLISTGPVDAQDLRIEADKLDAYEQVVRATLKARTRLTEGQAQTYVRRTVVLNSEDARDDGIVDGIATFAVPPGARSWLITSAPLPGGRPALPTALPSN